MSMVFEPVYSHEELCEICRNTDFEKARGGSLNMARYREPFTRELVGKELPCVFDDGNRIVVRFTDVNTLYWSENGGEFHEEYCEPLKSSAGNVIGVHFIRRHTLPFEGAFVVFDMDTGFVTWVTITLGTDFDEKHACPYPHFGEIEGFGTHEGMRHHFSTDLVGKSIDWQYNEQFTIRHTYATPTLTIAPHLPEKDSDDGDEGFVGRRFLRAFNATIRNNLVLTGFTEPGNCCAVLLIDLNIVHDIGCFYGISYEGTLDSETITALGGLGKPGLRAEEGYAPPLVGAE